jgi:two-component system cell cycle response regulator
VTVARLLVVEDNKVNLDLMTYLLTAFGHEVVGVDNGHAALGQLHGSRFDLVVCDVQMPGMDGLQLLRELRADPATAQLTVVAVTAAAMVGDRERLLAAGFDGYLAKPIDPESFVHHIGEFIARQCAVTASRS